MADCRKSVEHTECAYIDIDEDEKTLNKKINRMQRMATFLRFRILKIINKI
jgi:hypothetical protein